MPRARADEHHDLADRGAHAGGGQPWDSRSAGTGMGSAPGWLSFRRIVDIPFETCVAALESWRREGRGGGLQAGHSRLCGPVEHDRCPGTCRFEVRLARGPLRPLLRMRLNVDGWSPSSRTALELIPCGRVRATASYFRAGHLLLDSLGHWLQLEREIQANAAPAGPVHKSPGSPPPPARQQPLHQLANELDRKRLVHAEQQRPARQHLVFRRASRRADRAERRMRNAVRKALRLRTGPEP